MHLTNKQFHIALQHILIKLTISIFNKCLAKHIICIKSNSYLYMRRHHLWERYTGYDNADDNVRRHLKHSLPYHSATIQLQLQLQYRSRWCSNICSNKIWCSGRMCPYGLRPCHIPWTGNKKGFYTFTTTGNISVVDLKPLQLSWYIQCGLNFALCS